MVEKSKKLMSGVLGRPRGSKNKDGYKMSVAALSVRRGAALVHGERSKLLRGYLGERSPIPSLVGDSEVGALRKELYLQFLNQGLEEPALLALDTLASLRAEMELERARADAAGEVLSDKWLRAAKLATDLTAGLAKLKHGSRQSIEVKHLKGFFESEEDVVINITPEEGGVQE